jgi:hypothetical protein
VFVHGAEQWLLRFWPADRPAPADQDPGLGGCIAAAYEPPVWPAQSGRPQVQAHLDIEVSDLERGVAHAVALGATVADVQPQDDVRVCFDPVSHPFCLFVRT